MKKVKPSVKYALYLLIFVFLFGGLFFFLSREKNGKKGMDSPLSETTRAKATPEYMNYFGKAPDVGMIKCEGFAAFFPSVNGDGFVPYPFFITTPERKDELVARTLISGLPTKALSRFVEPLLPGGWRLDGVEKSGETISFAVVGDGKVTEDILKRAADSLYLTYTQFYPHVREVRIKVKEGKIVSSKGRGLRVVEPGPPHLLDAFLVKEEGEEEPREIRVIFDRPVMILDFKVTDEGGNDISGKVFLAEFSMAGILEFGKKFSLKEGTKVKISYKIHDYLGRTSEGENEFPLRVEVHSR